VPSKLTIRMILRKGLIAQIGLQVSNLVRNDSPEACFERFRFFKIRIGTELQ